MTPYYDKDGITIYCGNSQQVIPHIGIVDAVCTDPPYGLSFMGRTWDSTVPPVDLWEAVFQALKPGGHLLSFAGTRTHHRMAVNIEDAGFEIRDMIAWVYGSGFPKSANVSKAIDKAAGDEREVVGETYSGIARVCRSGGEIVGGTSNEDAKYIPVTVTVPATEAAKQWDGWGTALKPALEPITMARKPMIGTVADNVQKHGTGAINIGGCRVGDEDVSSSAIRKPGTLRHGGTNHRPHHDNLARETTHGSTCGRWPANLIHDGSDEVVEQFPETTSGANPTRRSSAKFKNAYGEFAGQESCEQHRGADAGNAARFFYCAKASSEDRGPGNNHPTVKPVALMRWLVRLVTCETSVVLDPFAGSGTTLVAAKLEGRRAIGIELDENYAKIAVERLKSIPPTLF